LLLRLAGWFQFRYPFFFFFAPLLFPISPPCVPFSSLRSPQISLLSNRVGLLFLLLLSRIPSLTFDYFPPVLFEKFSDIVMDFNPLSLLNLATTHLRKPTFCFLLFFQIHKSQRFPHPSPEAFIPTFLV